MSAVTPPQPVRNPLIVVGVSSSTGSCAALRWAAAASGGAGARVRAVLAWRMPRAPSAPGGRPPAFGTLAGEDPQNEAQSRLASLVAEALGPDHGVECVVVRGSAVSVLLDQAREADLLVVDSPRTTKLTTVSATFVAPHLIFEAACPVVVMPPSGAGPMERVREVTGRMARAAAEAAASAGRPGLPPRLPGPQQ